MLEAAGVNLLLVPALTVKTGAFNGAICGLASRCQAVAVIVNAHVGRDVFAIMAAVPRPESAEQARQYRLPADAPALGVFDPNVPLDDAVAWQALG